MSESSSASPSLTPHHSPAQAKPRATPEPPTTTHTHAHTFPLCDENIHRSADKPSGQLTASTRYFFFVVLFSINFGLNASLWMV